jgi:hypothetical protein
VDAIQPGTAIQTGCAWFHGHGNFIGVFSKYNLAPGFSKDFSMQSN